MIRRKPIVKINDTLSLREGASAAQTGMPVLIVEDDMVDAMTIRRAFNDVDITNRLEIVWNAEEAIEYLGCAEPPGVIFLDLNMPGMKGVDLLDVIKRDDALKRIPVIVMSTSDNESDKSTCFSKCVDGYMVKPLDYADFVESIRTINRCLGVDND